jgi:pilus assembly protein Flp/PilA
MGGLMKTLFRRSADFLKEENGPTIVEYAVLMAGIVIVVLGVLYQIGFKVNTAFTTVSEGLPTDS